MNLIDDQRAGTAPDAAGPVRPWARCSGHVARCPTGGRCAYPERPIELIVPWGPGGGADQLGRKVAQLWEPLLQVSLPVINVPGASGVTGLAKMLAAPADGYSVSVITADTIGLQARPAELAAGGHHAAGGADPADLALLRRAGEPVSRAGPSWRRPPGARAEGGDHRLRHRGRPDRQLLPRQGAEAERGAVRQAGRALRRRRRRQCRSALRAGRRRAQLPRERAAQAGHSFRRRRGDFPDVPTAGPWAISSRPRPIAASSSAPTRTRRSCAS